MRLLLFLIPAVVVASVSAGDGISKPVADGINSFTTKFLKKVYHKKTGNFVVSPVSLTTLLAMLQQGAKSNTLEQLTRVLSANPQQTLEEYSTFSKLLQESHDNANIVVANAAYIKKGDPIKQPFESTLKQKFRSDIEFVEFGNNAEEVINSWVKEKTRGHIKELFAKGSLSPEVKMALVNAIYFKSVWRNPFPKELTYERAFHIENGKDIRVPCMTLTSDFITGADDTLRWLEIPYEGQRYSLLVVIPKATNKLEDVVNKLTDEELTKILQALKQTDQAHDVQVFMPKFKISTDLDASQIFKEIGLEDIFDSGKADLSGISDTPLSVSIIKQKAEFELDEEGTVAAAATDAVAEPYSSLPVHRPELFNVDRPFLFYVMDKINGIPLFSGKIVDPSK